MLAAIVVVVLTACGETSVPPGSAGTPPPTWALPYWDHGMDALVQGEVTWNDLGCVFLSREGDVHYPVVFPSGTTVRGDPPILVLPNGDEAGEGDIISGGGGFVHPEMIPEMASGGDVPTEVCLEPGSTYREVAVFNNAPDSVALLGPVTPSTAVTTTSPASRAAILSPPAGLLYHAVYPGGRSGAEDDLTLDDLVSYEDTVGKPAAWVYFSHNWYGDREFPRATATWIRDHGSTPYVRLMLRDETAMMPDPGFTLDRILGGEFDADLATWARGAAEFGSPVIVEFGTEVNGDWFPWNGRWNGGGDTTGYGDPSRADGPERFRDAFRHIVDLMDAAGADNLTWVFHVDDQDWPQEEWNRLEAYYPGPDYVDWIGVSVYGALTPLETSCAPFRESLDAVYPRLVGLGADIPIVVLEFGTTANSSACAQVEWAHDALIDLTAGRWPRVIGLSWWNERWENDDDPAHDTTMRVQDAPQLADTFFLLIGGSERVLGGLILDAE